MSTADYVCAESAKRAQKNDDHIEDCLSMIGAAIDLLCLEIDRLKARIAELEKGVEK